MYTHKPTKNNRHDNPLGVPEGAVKQPTLFSLIPTNTGLYDESFIFCLRAFHSPAIHRGAFPPFFPLSYVYFFFSLSHTLPHIIHSIGKEITALRREI